MKQRLLFTLFALLLPLQVIAETLQFTGEITELAETGRGAEVWLRLTQAEDGSSLDFILSDEKALELERSQWLTITYQKVLEPLMIGLRLTSEPINARFSSDTPQRFLEQAQYTQVGDYISGQLGDAGMYLQLKDRYQTVYEFVGVFELDADNAEKYTGKEIEITYIKEEKTKVLDYENPASNADETIDCTENAVTQVDINRCSYEGYEQADLELNKIYRKILTTYNDEVEFVKKLKVAQRAWIAFRDAHLETIYPEEDKRFAYGSTYPLCSNNALTELTRQRITQLQQWLTGLPEGDACGGSIRVSTE
ncbi:lysozyme inhibitor LprI family protein [Candidatus Albibeggiatoa sp. nov. BB20]|uniref:lysozyme inhibitor LprI family protein n=1 Tax=Candidatus Albibeggiatoa sp. nov. BB20 TaxID=3162723 RepID=UPI0033659784